jgi:3-hydroxy-3-methylglutaryl CoA synthase/uncharacterized OB-fold protein
MRGILAAGGYVPHFRLRHEAIAAVLGGSPGSGSRAVANHDEDATTMAVAAARLALHGRDLPVGALWFATSSPTYLDKTNATAIHAALRLERSVLAADMGGATRSGVAALLGALRSTIPTLVVAADVRTALPGSPDETVVGDGAAALLVGSSDDGPLLAEVMGSASATEEFLDRWRVPGEARSRQWEERFGETRYVPLAREAAKMALEDAGIESADQVVVTGMHPRAVASAARPFDQILRDDLASTVGITGTAHPLLLLADAIESMQPGQTLLLLSLADGADAVVLRMTDAVTTGRSPRPVAAQAAGGADVSYADYLSWRGLLDKEPPRRPEPARMSASAAARSADWKYGFVGSRDRDSGAVHLPPARVSFAGGAVDDMDPAPMADTPATVVTFTVDRLAWSPSPPTVFAVLDFDGGGRIACEVTDVDPVGIAIGDRMQMAFRIVNRADGITNYFWKARPADPAEDA